MNWFSKQHFGGSGPRLLIFHLPLIMVKTFNQLVFVFLHKAEIS
jgi:hypothetical protein